jgi:hypothetical protein
VAWLVESGMFLDSRTSCASARRNAWTFLLSSRKASSGRGSVLISQTWRSVHAACSVDLNLSSKVVQRRADLNSEVVC